MKKPQYTPGQLVEVELHNSKQKKTIWLRGTVIGVISATDIPYRIEIDMNFTTLSGHTAAHPDCMRPLGNYTNSSLSVKATIESIEKGVSAHIMNFRVAAGETYYKALRKHHGKSLRGIREKDIVFTIIETKNTL